MAQLKVKFKGKFAPHYQSADAAGADLYSANEQDIIIRPGEYKAIPTGLMLEIPKGFEGEIRPRSGLAKNYGIGILNTPGTIDADYRGEIEIVLFNLSKKSFRVKSGMRIAQLLIKPVPRVKYVRAQRLSKTRRGNGGFGHTGV
ncbi:MAG: dUTP diphosphatase [candidate division WOR-3 bacterium]